MKNIGKISLYFMLACVVTNSNAMQEPKLPDQQLTINVDSVATPKARPNATIEWLASTPNTTPSPGSTPENRKQDFKSALLAVNSGNQASSRRNSQKPEVSEETVLGELEQLWQEDRKSVVFSQFCRQEDTAFQLACVQGDERTMTQSLDVLYELELPSTDKVDTVQEAMTYVRRYYWQYNVRYALSKADKLITIKTLLHHRAVAETIWPGTFISITEVCDMLHKHQASVDIVQYLVGYLQAQPESTQYLEKTVQIACEQYLTQAQVELLTLNKDFARSLQIDQEKERQLEQEKERRASRSPSRSKVLQAQVQPQQAKWTPSSPAPKSSFDQDNNVVTIVASPSLSTRTAVSPRKDLNPLHPARQVTQTGSSPGSGRQTKRDSLPKLGEAPDARLLTVPAYLND